MRFIEKPHIDSPKNTGLNKIPCRHKTRWIFLLSTISGHL